MVVIEKRIYNACDYEFTKIYKQEYCNLEMYDVVGLFERLSGLINDICLPFFIKSPIFINPTHGGFLPINVSHQPSLETIQIYYDKKTIDSSHYINIVNNINRHSVKKISIIDHTVNTLITELNNASLLFIDNTDIFNDVDFLNKHIVPNCDNIIIISPRTEIMEKIYDFKYRLSDTKYNVYISKKHNFTFLINLKDYSNFVLSHFYLCLQNSALSGLCLPVLNSH